MPVYYPINETLARQANMMNSHYEYKAGSATAEYHAMVDEAAAIAEKQKARTDPMYHEKIDRLLDTYARKLADNFNENFEIQTRCPSILVAGRANFPVRKKEKQNAASDQNTEEYRRIRGLLEKIRSTGMGGVSSDDGSAIARLRANLESRERIQEEMKAVNAYYRKNGTLQGRPLLTPEDTARLEVEMSRSCRQSPKPYESFLLSNNNAEIRRLRARIEELEQRQTVPAPEGWTFNGGKVVMNREENRVQIIFGGKPDAEARAALKQSGFHWAPSQNAWQRMLNQNGIYAAKQVTEAWMSAESEQAVMEEPEADAPAPSSWMQQMM